MQDWGYQGGQQPQGPMPPQPQSTLSPKELAWAQSQLQPGQQAQMSAVMPGGGTGTMPMPAAGASPGAPSTPAPSAPAPSGPTVVADGGYQQKMQRAMALRDIGDKMAGQGLGLQANKYYDMADKLIPQFKEDKVYTQNGQRVVVRTYNDGSYQVLQGVQPDLEKAHMADTGNAIVPLNAFTGAPQGPAIVKSQDPNSVASNALGYAHLAETQRHNQVIEGDPATIEANAQAIAAGKQAPMTGAAARNPIAMQIMARVEQINPDFNAQDFGTAQKAMKDFSSGKLGQQTRSFSVALTHLDTLGQLADALQNKDTQVINRVGNFFSTQTGQPAPTNFNAAKQIVGDEIVKAIVGSGGGVGDREKAQQAISAASSPAQLKGVIDTYKTLMAGQLHGFQQQYEQSTGRKDFQRFLSPEAQAITTGNTTNAVRAKADAILSGQ